VRFLFSAVGAAGHLLPLVPLADAASDAGHEVAFVSAANMAGYLDARALLPAGTDSATALAETERRTGAGDGRNPGAAAVELFAGVRVDLGFDAALNHARGYAPDLLVCDALDFTGPMVAAALGLPWASFAVSAPLPPALIDAMIDRSAAQHDARGLHRRQRFAWLDPLPDVLRTAGDPPPPADRITVRPVAHSGDRANATTQGLRELPSEGPRVLVTAGTSVQDPGLLADLAVSVVGAGCHAVVTAPAGTGPQGPRVHNVGFVALARLLPKVDAVVGTAGFGTVLATLAAGLPSVMRPVLADQPRNAGRVAAAGAGIAIKDSAAAGPAVRNVLTDPGYRHAAQAAAVAIGSMPAPGAILGELLSRAGLCAGVNVETGSRDPPRSGEDGESQPGVPGRAPRADHRRRP